MEGIIKVLTSNNILMILGLFLVAILIFSVIKQLLKLVYLAAILLVIYVGYLYYTGQKIPTTKDEVIKHSYEQFNKIEKSRKEIMEDVKKRNEKSKKKEIQ